jgi:hypothetical protein
MCDANAVIEGTGPIAAVEGSALNASIEGCPHRARLELEVGVEGGEEAERAGE